MNFFKDWWQCFLKNGIFFSYRRCWWGEEKLPPPKINYHSPIKEEVEEEIRNSLHKKGGKDGANSVV